MIDDIRFFFQNGGVDKCGRGWGFWVKVILFLALMLALGIFAEFEVHLPWYV